MIQRLKTLYTEQVIPALTNDLGYKNAQEIPKVEKNSN